MVHILRANESAGSVNELMKHVIHRLDRKRSVQTTCTDVHFVALLLYVA